MTYEEALQETAKRINLKKLTHEPSVLEYYQLVKEALEKQIPKKPDGGYDIFYGEDAKLCPVCGDPRPDTYCGTCGQRLDWSDENETND